MIVHTDLSDDELEKMEIGDGSWLTVVDMDEDYITPDPAAPPIVLLLGCETGAPGVGFAGFVSRCLEYGAAVVVAAGAKIHSAHAVPVARAFVDALHRESAAGTGSALGAASMRSAATFGEVMRRVKCDLLAEGLPMVLTLTAHGDADWRLVSEEITITEPAPATDPDSPVADPHSPSPEPPAP
jgi:hypothetical protein